MEYLYNSSGKQIAVKCKDQLHAPSGENIGHYVSKAGIYIDMRGNYLGEIVKQNRLMYRKNNNFQYTCFGSYGNYGNIGTYRSHGNFGYIGHLPGFKDITNSN